MKALSLMDLHPKVIFLTDDSAARLAAEHRGINAHGREVDGINEDEYRKIERDIYNMFSDLISLLTIAAQNKSYLKTPSLTPPT